MKKRLLLLSTLFLVGCISVSTHCVKPKLTSGFIKWLDNKPLALDCAAMGDILHVRREIRKMQFGVQDASSKQFVGYYLFEGKNRTLRWLSDYEKVLGQEFSEQKVLIEKKYVDQKAYQTEWKSIKSKLESDQERKFCEQQESLRRTESDPEEHEFKKAKLSRKLTLENEEDIIKHEAMVKRKYIKDKVAYDREINSLNATYQKKMKEILPCLNAAHQDFITANAPFATKMEGTKQMLLKLVEEFCLKFRKPYSYLLEWADVDDGQEFIIFEKSMNSCRKFDEFCTDLTEFLEALYYSCDKARAEFEAKQKQNK